MNLGFYKHARSHSALFTEVLYGNRRYFKSGIFLEHALGLGIMFSFYPEEVWHVDELGSITRVSNSANPDFSPSVTLGVGYNFGKEQGIDQLLWLRPRISWQLPYNNISHPHLALQIGYSQTIQSK